MTIEFQKWPSTTRLFKDVTITEKVDGTNSAVVFANDGADFAVQSRTRLITPEDDNFGFATWAYSVRELLHDILGDGVHYGEWMGAGIQKGYGLDRGLKWGRTIAPEGKEAERRFLLFNTHRWGGSELAEGAGVRVGGDAKGIVRVGVVPVLYEGAFSEEAVRKAATFLHVNGSVVAPTWKGEPEGVVVYWHETKVCQKFTPWHGNDGHKGGFAKGGEVKGGATKDSPGVIGEGNPCAGLHYKLKGEHGPEWVRFEDGEIIIPQQG